MLEPRSLIAKYVPTAIALLWALILVGFFLGQPWQTAAIAAAITSAPGLAMLVYGFFAFDVPPRELLPWGD